LQNAERNVLPLLNNLLENREMALDDGSFMAAPTGLRPEEGEELEPEPEARRKVLHCDAGFVVVAIGWPQPACAEITGDLVSRRG
jgi:hypothetical protein